ncbi:MAG: hypothetical protein ACR2MS_02395 [Weeksellaceae bacterium]
MPLKHHERAHEGFKSEDEEASSLKRKGHRVLSVPRNNAGYDLVDNGEKVDVKAAIETSYKGSDGYPITGFVFSNMKKNPKTDKYVLKCMSPDRKRVLKTYEIPAKEVKQRTLTITKNSKYEPFLKKAFMAHRPHAVDRNREVWGKSAQPAPYRSGDGLQMVGTQESIDPNMGRKIVYRTGGAITGAIIGLGPTNLGRVISGQGNVIEDLAPNVIRGLIGAAVGYKSGEVAEIINRNR